MESSVVEDTNKEIDNPVDTYELPNDHVIDLLQEESGSTLTVKSSDESHLISTLLGIFLYIFFSLSYF